MSTLAAEPGCNPVCRVCHYREIPYPAQLERKQAWADSCLATWKDCLGRIVPAPKVERIGYRAKSWMRAEIVDGRPALGMFRAVRGPTRWEKEFVSWDGCPIHLPAIRETSVRLLEFFSENAMELFSETVQGIWFGAPHLVVVTKVDRSEILGRFPWEKILVSPINQVWVHRNPQVGRTVFGRGEIRLLVGASASDEPIHPIRAFRQIAQSLLEQARARAVDALLSVSPSLVVDLYCGTGDLAPRLPESVAWLGIETSQDAAIAANLRRPEKTTAFAGTVEQRLRDPRVRSLIKGAYSLYINPPRSGLSSEAIAQLVELLRADPARKIVYLSCSASSLARDLRSLEEAGYEVETLQPYDFFPHTEHFETLAVLGPRSGRNSMHSVAEF